MTLTNRQLINISAKVATNRTFTVDNVQGLITEMHGCTVIALRGMEVSLDFDSATDIIQCLKAYPKKTKECGRVHSGIWHAAKSARGEVLKLVPKGATIILTGFSMGGAIAVLLSKLLPEYTILKCVTFGSPKVVHKKYAHMYDNVTQFTIDGDIITKFPGRIWNYVHINEQRLGPNKSTASWDDHDTDRYRLYLSLYTSGK
jgi:hypothetical protein